jgi:hypothetical protein
MKAKTFYWNQETIENFRFIYNYINKEELLQRITEFIEVSCEIYEDETEQDLVSDLLMRVVKY